MADYPETGYDMMEVYPCAGCGTGVETYWTTKGMISNRNYVLVASWVFHGSCWDGLICEHPPEGEK